MKTLDKEKLFLGEEIEEKIELLSQEEKDKCEFLVNAICPPGCKTRREHYILNSKYYLNYGRQFDVPYCGI